MKLKPWIQSMLHIGWLALLLLQGHRIQKLQMTVADDGLCIQKYQMTLAENALRIQKYRMTVADDALRYEEWRQSPGQWRQSSDWFAQEDAQVLATLQEHYILCMQSKAECMQSKADSKK
jgi:hypothetical protein